MVGLEHRKKELETFLAGAKEPPPLLHMAMHYRAQIEELYEALQEDSEAKRMTPRYHPVAGEGAHPDA